MILGVILHQVLNQVCLIDLTSIYTLKKVEWMEDEWKPSLWLTTTNQLISPCKVKTSNRHQIFGKYSIFKQQTALIKNDVTNENIQ